MEAGITTKFEQTDFAGISAKIINPGKSPFTILDMKIKPGFCAPAHISASEDKLFIVLEGTLKYLIGDRTEVVEPGARVQVPRGSCMALLMSVPLTHAIFLSLRPDGTRSFSAISATSPNHGNNIWIFDPELLEGTIRRSSGLCHRRRARRYPVQRVPAPNPSYGTSPAAEAGHSAQHFPQTHFDP